MEDKARANLSLRVIGLEAIESLEKEIVEEHIRAVYENLQFDTEVEKELDECSQELLICYRLKRRLNEYIDKHICSSQNPPSV